MNENYILFNDERKGSHLPKILLPISIILLTLSILCYIRESTNKIINLFCAILMFLFVLFNIIMMIKWSFCKIVGTSDRLILTTLTKSIVILLADIEKADCAYNFKGGYHYSLLSQDTTYDITIRASEKNRFDFYLRNVIRNIRRSDYTSDESLFNIKKIRKNILVPEIIAAIVANSIPILFMILMLMSAHYYNLAAKVFTIYRISLFFTIPSIAAIILKFIKKDLINYESITRVAIVVLLIILAFFAISFQYFHVYVSYDKKKLSEIEEKIDYHFPSENCFETHTDYYYIESIVTTTNKKSFYKAYDSIAQDVLWRKDMPRYMLDFIKICFRDKDIDYYICFFVNDSGNSKVLYDEGENYVMFNELGKYYVVGVSECERRFYIYQFNIVEIKR